jgi:hypothetical protein
MGFIELFFKSKKGITEKELDFFVSQKVEENLNLDYKDIRAYRDCDGLATDISSFANTEGGLLILGVSEDATKDEKGKIARIFPKEITWGSVSLDKESLENRLAIRIKPPIAGLIIKPIRNEKNKVVFLIDIPKSDHAPHMSFDNRYHKRMNFRTCPMEHYEIANLFRVIWTLKEKLVEKIYEPLASVLEKQAKQLREFNCPYGNELEEVLAKTYYKAQMPFELFEQIDYYNDQIEDLSRKEYYARAAMIEIINRNVLEYLKKPKPDLSADINIGLKALSSTGSTTELYTQKLLEIALTNQDFQK